MERGFACQRLKNMAVYLVTGGAGFIGSNLVDALVAVGHQVRVIDNFSTGKRANLNPAAELFEYDFTDLDVIRPVFDGVDCVFHVGARPSVPFSVEHPLESTVINIMGTLNVLLAAREARVKRVIYSASSSAYGIQPTLPQRPDMTPNPLSPYALQKYVGEKYCEQFAKYYGLETVALRYFNVYGPRMNDQGAYAPVFLHFIAQKKKGEALTIFGTGEQTRDFTHVSDVVQANLLALSSSRVGRGEVLNVGAGGRVTLNTTAKIIGGPVVHLEPRPGDIPHSQADISLTTELLDWEPRISFDPGLRQLLRDHGLEPAC